ncbi:hypothetical protein DFR33_104370 [Bradymonas sediminis]|nr:hypothetical protein DFR33_104370 [Bradymonas sediminis]
MMKKYKLKNLLLSLFAVAALCFGLAACGSDEAAEPECTDDFDCAFAQSCNVEAGVCESNIGSGGGGHPTLPDRVADAECSSDAGCALGQTCNVALGKCEAGESSNNNNANNTPDPNVCNPACASDETCDSGTCVPNTPVDPNVCDPGCDISEHCSNGQCVPNASDPNVCSPACATGYTCDSGTCVADNPPADGCDPGCDISEHCSNGQCVPNASNPNECNPACGFGETCQAGTCVADTPDPDVCNPACPSGYTCQNNICIPPQDGCNGSCPSGYTCEGSLCVPESTGGGQPCTLWTSNNGCASNEVCNPVSDTQGVCTSSIDPAPSSLGDQCSPSYETCGQMSDGFGVACLANAGDTYSCFMHCRVGYGDCDFLDDYWTGEYYYCVGAGSVFPGAPNVGVCSQ